MHRTHRVWPVLVVIVLAVLLGAAMPAGAHISSVTIDPNGEIGNQGRVRVHGTITCDAGEEWVLRGNVKQFQAGTTVYRGSGFDRFNTCTGAPQGWLVVTRRHTGTPTPGNAQVCYLVRTTLGGTFHDRAHDCFYPVTLS
jgi:hypothetical protein